MYNRHKEFSKENKTRTQCETEKRSYVYAIHGCTQKSRNVILKKKVWVIIGDHIYDNYHDTLAIAKESKNCKKHC